MQTFLLQKHSEGWIVPIALKLQLSQNAIVRNLMRLKSKNMFRAGENDSDRKEWNSDKMQECGIYVLIEVLHIFLLWEKIFKNDDSAHLKRNFHHTRRLFHFFYFQVIELLLCFVLIRLISYSSHNCTLP